MEDDFFCIFVNRHNKINYPQTFSCVNDNEDTRNDKEAFLNSTGAYKQK